MSDAPTNAGARSAAQAPRGAGVDPGFWRGRRVLITGHTGFKGAWLSLWLQSLGSEVIGFANGVLSQPSLYELADVGDGLAHEVIADIRDADAIERAIVTHSPEIVVHMAAQSLVRRSFEQPRLTYETNVMGTVNLLDAVRRHEGVRVVVNVTSDKCYENREWEWGYREHEPMGGHDPYSNSKGCAELVTDAFRRSFFSAAQCARVASARAGNVIGGGDWAKDRLIPDMMRAALAGEVVHIRNPAAVRPWQHVLNPLSGYLRLVETLWEDPSHACGWNFGPAEEDAKPVDWIVMRLGLLWPGELRVTYDEGEHPHEARYLKLDSTRARTCLDWRPAWGLAEGLQAVVDWYRGLRDGEDMRAVTLSQIESFEHALQPA
jgi:CDP-glucose 4,6-dehydratase